MRIKSYFDSSIQTAMRQARHEFGEDVMLVTSRIASPELRYLGDFEVVFAVDENETEPEAAKPPQPELSETAFGEMYRLASAARATEEAREAAIADIHSRLLDMGLDLATTEGMIARVRLCAPRSAAQLPLSGLAYEPVLLPPEKESAPDSQASSARVPLGPLPTAAPPESGALDLTPRAEGSAVQSPPGPLPTGGRRSDSRRAQHAVPPRLRKSGVASQCGFPLMLAAFSLYGIIRRSGS